MEPSLTTPSHLLPVLNELKRREPLFHRAEFGRTRADLERMTDPSFWEVGASGRRYSREYVFEELAKRYSAEFEDVWETSDFQCREIADGAYLLTYTLTQPARVTRRSTIWRRTPEGWKAFYHQGTVVAPDCS